MAAQGKGGRVSYIEEQRPIALRGFHRNEADAAKHCHKRYTQPPKLVRGAWEEDGGMYVRVYTAEGLALGVAEEDKNIRTVQTM